jgi:hypothetical protein
MRRLTYDPRELCRRIQRRALFPDPAPSLDLVLAVVQQVLTEAGLGERWIEQAVETTRRRLTPAD